MASTFERGRDFEGLAAEYLARRGWTVLDRNVRHGPREIDLIVRRGVTVAFVEVKGRTGPSYGDPLEAITFRKRSEILRVARWWMARHGLEGWEYRFDAVAVRHDPRGEPTVEHVEDAWRAGE